MNLILVVAILLPAILSGPQWWLLPLAAGLLMAPGLVGELLQWRREFFHGNTGF